MSTTRIGSYTTQSYPPAALTANTTNLTGQAYANGIYTVSSSTIYSVAYTTYMAFDQVNTTSWCSVSPTYNASSPYAYTGTVTTKDISGTSYSGEWLQIQLAFPIIMSSYSIQARTDSTNILPSAFQILGSKDGQNWTLVNSQTAQTWSAFSVINTYSVSSTQAYSYYRIVCSACNGNTAVSMCQWTLNGTQTSLTVGADGQLGIGVANPVQALEVAGQIVQYFPVHLSLYGTPSFYNYLQQAQTTIASIPLGYTYIILPTLSTTSQNWTPSYKNTCCLNIPYTGLYALKFSYFIGPSGSLTIEPFISKSTFDNANDLAGPDRTLCMAMQQSVYANATYYNEYTISCTAYLLNTDFINYGFYINAGALSTTLYRFSFVATLIQRTS